VADGVNPLPVNPIALSLGRPPGRTEDNAVHTVRIRDFLLLWYQAGVKLQVSKGFDRHALRSARSFDHKVPKIPVAYGMQKAFGGTNLRMRSARFSL
jgi:hypothetical protein